MNRGLDLHPEPDDRFLSMEKRVSAIARAMPYPPTPDLSSRAARWMGPRRQPQFLLPRRAVWVVVSLAVIILALIAVPPVRAQIIQWIRIGVVEIFQVEPTPAPVPTAAPADAPSGAPIASTLPTLTPEPTPTALLSPLDLDGETTLEELRAEGLAFPVRLPAYPDDLGEPEKVFLQNAGGPVVILVWYDEGTTRDIRLVLYELGPTARGYEKIKPLVVEETTVNGQPAVWTVGPYMLKARNGDMRVYRLVEGATLIWVENEITYRLEIDLPLDEARKIAESLQE